MLTWWTTQCTDKAAKDSGRANTIASDGELLAADQVSEPPFRKMSSDAWQVNLDLRRLLVGGAAILLTATALALTPWRRYR